MYPELQKIRARLQLKDGSYNIYTLIGQSEIGKPYEYEVSFVSPKKLMIEEMVDTDVDIFLEDERVASEKRVVCGKIYKASEESVIDRKHLYRIKVVHPMYYLGQTKRYEIYQDKTVVDIRLLAKLI